MYFQDLSNEQQEKVFEYVKENIIKQQYTDFEQEAENCNMSIDDWLNETADDYINCNNDRQSVLEWLQKAY